MSDFETYACSNCGDDFEAHPSARAAQTEYCSPACHTAGEGL
jgi:DNA-directed RNA polymerase subunit RPC12/RpoP